jgi:hypothetical protein
MCIYIYIYIYILSEYGTLPIAFIFILFLVNIAFCLVFHAFQPSCNMQHSVINVMLLCPADFVDTYVV